MRLRSRPSASSTLDELLQEHREMFAGYRGVDPAPGSRRRSWTRGHSRRARVSCGSRWIDTPACPRPQCQVERRQLDRRRRTYVDRRRPAGARFAAPSTTDDGASTAQDAQLDHDESRRRPRAGVDAAPTVDRQPRSSGRRARDGQRRAVAVSSAGPDRGRHAPGASRTSTSDRSTLARQATGRRVADARAGRSDGSAVELGRRGAFSPSTRWWPSNWWPSAAWPSIARLELVLVLGVVVGLLELLAGRLLDVVGVHQRATAARREPLDRVPPGRRRRCSSTSRLGRRRPRRARGR